MDRLELLHGGHACELESVVLVNLAFDVAPFPGVFVGGADERLVAQALREIVDPAGRSAGFHDDEISFVLFEDGGEVITIGGRVKELVFASFCVEEAVHGIEFTEIESENFHVTSPLRSWRVIECD